MEEDVSPGFFHLPLPINDKNIAKEPLKKKLFDIEHDLKARLDRPEELAIHNVLGLLKCYLELYKEALENFHTVLKKDPDNLNALANMQHVLKKLYRNKEAKSVQGQLDELNSHPTGGTDGALATDTHQQRFVRARARCLAEQAYVYSCDIHTDEAGHERYQQSNDIFKRALQYGGDLIETSERDFWEFIMGKNANKLFNSFNYKDDRLKATDYLEISVNLFHGITQRNPGDPEYQWESWRNMADIFRKIKITKHLSANCITLPELRSIIQSDPEECMKKAMAISPNNPRLLARYANFVYSLKRDTCTKRALELLDKSISLDGSDYNFYAFSTRGMINLKSYQWRLRISKEDKSRYSSPDSRMLEMAKDDLEKAIEYRNTSWNLVHLAEVHYLLAVNSTETSDVTRRRYIEKAFEFIRRAEDCKDHPDVQKDVNRARGRILFELGDYQEAIDCFKMSVDLEPATSNFTGYFHELFRCYLCLLQGENKCAKAESLLSEMASSLRKALIKYGGNNLIKYCFGSLRKEYMKELQMFNHFCEKIQDNDGLLYVLRSRDPTSPLSPPVRQGGTLKKPWENSFQPPFVRTTRAGNLSVRSDANSQTPYPPVGQRDTVCTAVLFTQDEKSDDPEDGEGLLVSGIEGIKISKPLAETVSEPGPQVNSSEGQNSSFCYDFYVMHAETDEDWVHNKLLHELENRRKLKGCTYARDCPPGSLVYKGELALMQQSANIVLILSADFTEKFQYLLQQALELRHSGHNIIPIKRDGSRVPDELRVLKCFDASGDRVEWDKLANSIKPQLTSSSTASGKSTEG